MCMREHTTVLSTSDRRTCRFVLELDGGHSNITMFGYSCWQRDEVERVWFARLVL